MFLQLTGENPWLPFLFDRSSARAIAERQLFDELKGNFKPNVSPSTPVHGYEAFSTAWCQEVGQRYLARLAGCVNEENVGAVVIYGKTAKQLADYYDKLEAEARTSLLSTNEATLQQRNLNRIIRKAHQNIATPTVVQVQPIRYPRGPQLQIRELGLERH